MTIKSKICVFAAIALFPLGAAGQDVLTLDQCRDMAVRNNKNLEQARIKTEMAGYDRKIARANYYPNITAAGTYMYNEKNLSLINEQMSGTLTNAGALVQGTITEFMNGLQQAIASNPQAAAEFMKSPMWQTVIGALKQTDISESLNILGSEIDDAFHLDIHNVFAAGVSLQQPVFMGGKIIAANRIAKLAEELAESQYDKEYQSLMTTVDQAYWQIVSIAQKKRMAENYVELLEKLEHDVKISVMEGVATKSDELSITVKLNEGNIMKTKATNGLTLAKMLLCKEIGIDLNTDIVLADEDADSIPEPELFEMKDMDEVLADRPETRSLSLASQIYDYKVRVARADMMPKVALTANYLVSNPNVFNGFQNKWGGMFNVGVAVSVPIFHGMEATRKTQKAKAEAMLYRSQYNDACDLINLQVTQLRKQQEEAAERLAMTKNDIKSAEENLRTATVGFENGVITVSTVLAAHTARLKAQSEFIDAGIEMQMVNVNLMTAEGRYKSDIK